MRAETLDEYFPCGMIPIENGAGGDWVIHILQPENYGYYVDPLLEMAIDNNYCSVSLNQIPHYFYIDRNIMWSFYDSWSCYYWSHVLVWLTKEHRYPKKITLFHFDDHQDLDTPHIYYESNEWISLFTGNTVSFEKPETIKEAITSQSIGIGSFIPTLLHHVEALEILHFRPAHSTQMVDAPIEPTFESDTILLPGKKRPSVSKASAKSPHRYLCSSNVVELIEHSNDSDIILMHINCDGWTNRFNLDSNWSSDTISVNHSLDQIEASARNLFSAVDQMNRPTFLNIAFSPGFFPGELWNPTGTILKTLSEQYNMIKEDSFCEYLQQAVPPTETIRA